MRITHTSVFVDDQQQALLFYTGKLGFLVKHDVHAGGARRLTLVSPQAPEGVELVLEPAEHPAVAPFRAALVADGIPFMSFGVKDVRAEHERLRERGVHFVQEPTVSGPEITAVLDDTCGNLIRIAGPSTG
ncbi:VOC family protein [Kocuria sp. NPDC057446]|uniref:VOC family protein n=1 Tax=Kocuria sp. NPDC057446 TaxID=3346137 RepID=UPI003683CEA3